MQDYQQRMHARAAVIDAIRRYFKQRGFLEVDTPVAITAPAPEPYLEAPSTTITTTEGKQRRFLQTSPELPMKRLVARGFHSIFQIAPVFRDGEVSPLHRPEFRMLEWYRANASWHVLMDDCEGLLSACLAVLDMPAALRYQGTLLHMTPPYERITVDTVFREYAGFSILDALTTPALQAKLTRLDVAWQATDTWDDLFHRAFLNRIEPALARRPRPFFLTHYPAPLAALARLCPEDPRVAERFELYAGGIELANAFGELTDAEEQRRRFERDRALRQEAGRAAYPVDEHFLGGLAGTPPFSGIALGVERLLMLLCDVADIDDVSFLPWSAT